MTNRQTRETLHSRQGGPRADHGADGAVAEAVRQVGADGGENACAQAPPRRGWYGLLPPVGVEGEHAVRIRPTRDQSGPHPGPAQPRTPLAPSGPRGLVGRGRGFKDPSPDRCLRLQLAALFVVQLLARASVNSLIGSLRPQVSGPRSVNLVASAEKGGTVGRCPAAGEPRPCRDAR